jgi:hypothetical protein
MFRCQNDKCKRNVEAGQPENEVITEQRNKTYEVANVRRRDDPPRITQGWEIKQKLRVCPECYRLLTGEEPKKFIPTTTVSTKVKVEEDRPRKQWKDLRKKKVDQRRDYREPRKPVVEVVHAPLIKE